MAQADIDVLTIGNAIVDVLTQTEEDFLVREKLVKGSMRLVDAGESERIYGLMGPGQLVSGGCAGNTAAGVASLGGRAAFIGKVRDDDLGRFFRHDMNSIGVRFPTNPLGADGTATGRCMILITPDTERTMNTFLGACQELTPADLDRPTIEGAAITYLEGYLWDPPKAKEAFIEAARIAHAAGRQVALTLSDFFCVDRYREEFIDLMKTGTVDIVFANHPEVMALYGTEDFNAALEQLERDVKLASVTLGAEGSLVLGGPEGRVQVGAPPVDTIVDKTGAGDLYASGFLFGLSRGAPLGRCAELGALSAGEIISHVGARPLGSLKNLAAQRGLSL
ncbi:adenosine kinase [Faunimonas pinastri]|uniref:Adenosine kinase n=1 Tax=Faunimonas pinastri TaxID=1855383 RepID=A0A1H9GPA3_9HYPH|nr:adenosine kinase [Faunimonas pinastri]SEQ51955.1 adenosine kinase [Faunimonas pinastri]